MSDPPEVCRIEVGGQVAHWAERGGLLFDDSCASGMERQRRSAGGAARTCSSPLAAPFSWLNRAVIRAISLSPCIRGARRMHRAWEERFEHLVAAW
jgi:hypothetical protein